jgi:omega-hydroxy-beta-dihydromenaquinone-9 sulfotransferase
MAVLFARPPYRRPCLCSACGVAGPRNLHNLLAQDERFAFPNTFQAFYPHTFLTTERTHCRLMAAMMPEKRPQDNVRMGVNQPQEDEFAQCSLTGYSFTMAWAFPRTARYDRFLTFRDASATEVRRWQEALYGFVQKLSFKYARPIVLKSPAHMARIRMLLQIFPDARFVHIHRHPYAVYQSSLHTAQKVQKWWALQSYERPDFEEFNLQQYLEMCNAYFEQRSLIDPLRFHELSFEDLEKQPLDEMRRLYERLALPDFETVRPRLQQYLDSIAGYRKNVLAELPVPIRDRLIRECRHCYDAWGYSVELQWRSNRPAGAHGRWEI